MRFAPLLLLAPLSMAVQSHNHELSPELIELIDQRVQQQVTEQLGQLRLLEPERQARIEEGIEEFIIKQQTAQRDAQEAASSAVSMRARAVDPENDYIRGNPEAPFTLIEYSDFECPFCARFHNTAKEFVEANDDVNWVYRHFPLEHHNPLASLQAEAVECAGELGGTDAFWQLTDSIISTTSGGGRGMTLEDIKGLAVDAGLDQAEFEECFDSRRHQDTVQADFLDGQNAGISGTPGNILRHNPSGQVIAVHGAQPLANLQDALNRLRERVAEE